MIYDDFFKELEKIEQAAAVEASDTRYAFNIFSLLRRDDEEVGLHSKFLAELLKSTGSHGIDTFQKLFIDQVLNAAVETQVWERLPLCPNQPYTCQTEIDIKGSGRIDIVLKNNDSIIVIENKINAYDQKNQLQRYFEACTNMGYAPENIYILYLNKYGEAVSDYGKGNLLHSQFAQITYKDDITSWLDACIIEAVSYPHIEQTLLQYRRLVGKLTGDTRSAKMKEAHIELLYQQDNFKLAYELSKSFTGFQIDLQKKIWEELKITLESKGYKFSFCDKNLQVCDFSRAVNNYYKAKNASKLYGIHCKIGSSKQHDIYCFIQINQNIYYGMTVSQDAMRLQYPDALIDLASGISNLYPNGRMSESKWFLGVNILPNRMVDFKKPSHLYRLVDRDSRKQWIEQTTNEVVSFIEKVKSLELIDVQSVTNTPRNTA
ncbi:PDDEXK-like family protein [Psychrobacter sp. AOP22-C1-C5]|uniref:PDDEXK-like family protein n=1 Tax=Psychrobacter sp. AOP22-C1-C5 TaxID=3457716 RepID=UPI00403638D4